MEARLSISFFLVNIKQKKEIKLRFSFFFKKKFN